METFSERLIDNYVILKRLYTSSTSSVYVAAPHADKTAQVVLKEYQPVTSAQQKSVERERDIWKNLNHPHIVSFIDSMMMDERFYLVVMYASGGDYYDHLIAHPEQSMDTSMKHYRQILSAVRYIHSCNIVHRDIKLENIVLHNNDAMLCDFGLSMQCDDADVPIFGNSAGSPYYAAPQLFADNPIFIPRALDAWSMGVVLYAMLLHKLPWDDGSTEEVQGQICNPWIYFTEGTDEDLRDAVNSLLCLDEQKRLAEFDRLEGCKLLNKF